MTHLNTEYLGLTDANLNELLTTGIYGLIDVNKLKGYPSSVSRA